MITARVQRMMDRLEVEKYPILAEKARLTIEAWNSHEGLPSVLQRAYATAHYLDNRTIYIDDDELIAGNVSSKPMGMEAATWGPFWEDKDLETMDSVFEISDEDRKTLRGLDSFWEGKGRQIYEWQGRYYDDHHLWPFIRSGILCPPWTDKTKGRGSGGAGFGWGLGIGLSFFVPDYEKIVKEGISKTLHDAEQELLTLRYHDQDSIDKADYLKAVIIALSSMVRMYHRYGDACQKKADETADETRKKEFLRMADTCHWIADNPSRNFRDALQNFYFYWMMIAHGVTPGGRFDQYMYPFYKKDIESGEITEDEVIELLGMLRIKIMQFNFISGGALQRDKWAGMARWHNFVIGGVDKDGNDATNELSYHVLQAAFDVRVPQYTITIRVNKNTPDALMKKGAELVRTGIGMPAFISDDSYISGLVDQGVPLEEARGYALAGCLDLNIPGKSRINALGMFIVPKVLDITMHNGLLTSTGEQIGPKTGEMKDFKTFDEFYTAFKTQLFHFMGMYNEEHNILIHVTHHTQPDVVHSAFTYEGITSGKDMNQRKMFYENASMFNPVGMINVVNSMAAVKKLVFDEKKFSMVELYSAIEADWLGYENIQDLCLNAPKYGNNDSFVDEIAKDLFGYWISSTSKFRSVYGEQPRPTGISITAHAPGGSYTCATPDGRKSGETLCDGVVSPAQGSDVHGPTASLQSAMQIDQTPFNAMLLNMKIDPSALKSDSDLMKLSALIKTYMFNGGKHIQFNVVDNKTLRTAQITPEKYRDLIVRVAGYSTYFTILTPAVQEEIIKRTENKL